MKIAIVVGDIGSAKELLPASDELVRRGAEVHWVADPAGRAKSDVLEKKGIAFEMREPKEEDGFDAILIGTSATAAALQISWTKFARERGVPVVWYEDLWGTAERSETSMTSPDVMLTIDEAAAELATAMRPSVAASIVGKPTFETLPDFATRERDIRHRWREQLLLDQPQHHFLVSYWSEGEQASRARRHLEALRSIGALWGTPIALAPRLHPKLSESDRRECMEIAASGDARLVHAHSIPLEELMITSDVVVADWGGTEGYRSMLLGTPTIITMFPDDTERRLSRGFRSGLPPHVRAQAVEIAGNESGLIDLIRFVVQYPDRSREWVRRKRRPFLPLVKPGAAARIADAILGLNRH